jgi:hypothetical protein
MDSKKILAELLECRPFKAFTISFVNGESLYFEVADDPIAISADGTCRTTFGRLQEVIFDLESIVMFTVDA